MRRHVPTRLVVAIHQDLVRVSGRRKVAPSLLRYRANGRFGTKKVQTTIGGYDYQRKQPVLNWCAAMRGYGLTPARAAVAIQPADLIKDLRRVAGVVGRAPDELPSVTEYRQHGRYSTPTVYRHLGGGHSWHRVGERAKLRPVNPVPPGTLSPERIIQDYQAVAGEMGYAPGGLGPTSREFDQRVAYSWTAGRYHLGSFRALQEKAGFTPRKARGGQGRR